VCFLTNVERTVFKNIVLNLKKKRERERGLLKFNQIVLYIREESIEERLKDVNFKNLTVTRLKMNKVVSSERILN
jgi:hypothetical protein